MGEPIEVAKVGEIADGEGMLVEIDGKELALFNSGGSYYAIDNECTHVGGPLSEGDLDGHTVTCPWHGAEFDLNIIPQTMAETTFSQYRPGSRVNLEVDVIARYLERLLQGDAAASPGGLSLETLAENGFLDRLQGKSG